MFCSLPVPGCIEVISQDPRYWFNKIRRIMRLPYFSIVTVCDDEKANDNIRAEVASYTCDICNEVKPSLKEINLHKFLCHGIRNPMYRYVDSSVCPICLVEHHTRERVLTHIKKAKTCHSILLQRGPILDILQANNLNELEKEMQLGLFRRGRRRNFAEVPCLHCEGPLCFDSKVFYDRHPRKRKK